ncbi:MAG: glycosyltransferase [Oscillospiraceae bacterium]|nr:glycosyltransferase [Oscillospiraceae bacterium]
MTLYAYLPCYNEEANITPLIEAWNQQRSALLELNVDLVIIGIDDCSSDGTKDCVLRMAERYDNVRLISHETNKGLVGGLNTAVTDFYKHNEPDSLMALMDGDNTHDPKFIIPMILKMREKSVDCVIASRYANNADVVGVAKNREFLSDMAKHYYKIMLSVPNVQDYTCGYRLYDFEVISNLIKQYGSEPIKEQSFACMMELLYKIYRVGAKFDEVGFTLRYDLKQGDSKMRVMKTVIKSLTTAPKLRFSRKLKGTVK